MQILKVYTFGLLQSIYNDSKICNQIKENPLPSKYSSHETDKIIQMLEL